MTQPLVTALAGVTIATRNPQQLADLFASVLGWRLVSEAPLSPEVSRSWGCEEAEGPAFILAAAGAERGMARIVTGDDRAPTRRLRARWAGVEILVARDLDALYETIARHPAFETTHVPFETDWSEFGSNVHRAFLGLGAGGTHLAFTMAVTKPVGRDFPATSSGVGYIFDVPLLTGAYDRSARFYRETLGMIPFLESHFTDAHWHEIWDLPRETPVHLDIMKGDAPGTGLGGIELQGYEAELVDDTPASPTRLDGGASIVTYTTADIDRAHAAVAVDPAATLLSAPTAFEAAPYHGTRAFCFMGPDGERVEVCEQPWR